MTADGASGTIRSGRSGAPRTMGYDTSRRALRGALPPFLFGFSLWTLSVGLHVVESIELFAPLTERLNLGHFSLVRLAAVFGAVAAGLILAGGAQLLRARVSNRRPWAALAFFALWLAELVLRLWTLASLPPTPGGLLATRAALAALAFFCLAGAMGRIAGEGLPGGSVQRSWNATRNAFAAQLALGLAFALALGAADRTVNREHLGGLAHAALWIALALPYTHAWLSLQRTVRGVAATETVAEILASRR